MDVQFKALSGINEDYVAKRLDQNLKPLSFKLKEVQRIHNPLLEKRFQSRKPALAAAVRSGKDMRELYSFHGSHPRNYDSICKTSLLRFKHPLNPCQKPSDDGWYGSNRKGVYVSRNVDYTFKYANRGVPLEPGETCNSAPWEFTHNSCRIK